MERRIAWIEGEGDQDKFNDEDELWAEGIGTPPEEARGRRARPSSSRTRKKALDSEIADTEAYLDDAIERMEEVWKTFQEMKVKDVINDEAVFRELKDRFGSQFGWGEYFRGGMGAEWIRDLLDQVEPRGRVRGAREMINTSKGQKQARAVKRLKVASSFLNSANKPEWMVLDCVPVIPPELRPMVQLDGGRFATSDLNDLYRRVINRNNRLKRLLDLGAPEIIVNNEKRMLQEAVDALFDNGRRGRPVTGPGNRALKSLSDMLKGKQGRFRQNLLGKRVDYSGRSVIVSGPSLKLHQCGLPKLMALELFKPFIMARLVERKAVQNIKAAKKMVDSMIPEVWDVLEEVIHEHPVLLNRAPTLHRLGIQAFEPVLVEGKAIQVHPLVCHAFNADFDGDQMAVHVPLSAEAQAEARILMLSSNNILSPASGLPLATPSQDMVLGIYYLTYTPEDVERARPGQARSATPHPFRTAQEAELAYENGIVGLQDYAEYRRPGHEHFLTTVGRIIFNDRIERALAEALEDEWDPERYDVRQPLAEEEGRQHDGLSSSSRTTAPAAISQALDAFKELGFHFATPGGDHDLEEQRHLAARQGGDPRRATRRGSPRSERSTKTATSRPRSARSASRSSGTRPPTRSPRRWRTTSHELNPIFMMANSGARGSFKQIRQLAGMRGLMANPKGEIIERPIKSNFMEGLSVLEYFISTHGARKGLADTALRTADSGYLTRRLVDVAQDVIVRSEDCKTKDFVEMPLLQQRRRAQREPDRPPGREEVRDQARSRAPQAQPGRSSWSSSSRCARRSRARTTSIVPVRSALKCELDSGICQACYGRSLATGATVEIGDAVGIIAAQSIGEPGTQLTMRTFHTGGVAGLDITQGLPRVVELFEARKPKGLAQIAAVDGKVAGRGDRQGRSRSTITDAKGEEHAYTLPPRTRLHVEHGEQHRGRHAAQRGLALPGEILEIRGRTATEVYLVGRGPARLQGPGRRHQRQAHRADRPPDDEEGAHRVEGLDHPAARSAGGPPQAEAA